MSAASSELKAVKRTVQRSVVNIDGADDDEDDDDVSAAAVLLVVSSTPTSSLRIA